MPWCHEEQACISLRAKRVSRERASEWRSREGQGKESLQRSLIKFHLYFAQTKGNTIGWKMTFRKTKLIDNRPSWHPLRLCDKFGSQGDQIGTKNVFQPSKQTRGLVWWSSRKENIAIEPRISRTQFVVLVEGKRKAFISCIRLRQAPCLVLKTRRVRVKRFKGPVQALPSNVRFFARLNSTGYKEFRNMYLTV